MLFITNLTSLSPRSNPDNLTLHEQLPSSSNLLSFFHKPFPYSPSYTSIFNNSIIAFSFPAPIQVTFSPRSHTLSQPSHISPLVVFLLPLTLINSPIPLSSPSFPSLSTPLGICRSALISSQFSLFPRVSQSKLGLITFPPSSSLHVYQVILRHESSWFSCSSQSRISLSFTLCRTFYPFLSLPILDIPFTIIETPKGKKQRKRSNGPLSTAPKQGQRSQSNSKTANTGRWERRLVTLPVKRCVSQEGRNYLHIPFLALPLHLSLCLSLFYFPFFFHFFIAFILTFLSLFLFLYFSLAFLFRSIRLSYFPSSLQTLTLSFSGESEA